MFREAFPDLNMNKMDKIFQPVLKQCRQAKAYKLESILEEFFVMSVPVALKTFFRVILDLQFKEITELRVAALHLFASGVARVGQIVGASTAYGHIDEPTESIRRVLQTLWAVNSVQVEDGAGVGLLGPRQEAFVISFDDADSAINQFDFVLAKILAYLR
jgi:hypothetical protein